VLLFSHNAVGTVTAYTGFPWQTNRAIFPNNSHKSAGKTRANPSNGGIILRPWLRLKPPSGADQSSRICPLILLESGM
jgi:hypothetical protein